MVQVNKKYIDKELQKEAWNRFLQLISASKSTYELMSNLRSFLTPTEIVMLEKRLCIRILLRKKLSYRAIGKGIDVSPWTISFVKRGLVRKPVVHRKHKSLLPEKKIKRHRSKYIAGGLLRIPRNYKGAESIF